LKQRISHQRKLCKYGNSTENRLVLQQVVPVCTRQNGPIFEPLVHGLLAASYPLLNFSSSRIRQETARSFYVGWGGAFVPPIRLTLFAWLQPRHQRIPENGEVIPYSGGIWPAPPANVACFNTEPHLVSQPALLELEATERLRIAHRNPKVGPIDRQQTIPSIIPHLPVLKFDLVGGMKVSCRRSKKIDNQLSTYHDFV
jgi:hypothetical protein